MLAELDKNLFYLRSFVWVTKTFLPTGSPLSEDKLTLEVRDYPWEDLDSILSKDFNFSKLVVNRPIQSKSILQIHHLKKEVMLKRQDKVRGIIRRGNIEIETLVTVLKPGYQGDSIEVKIENTKKIVSAKILDKDFVEIIE